MPTLEEMEAERLEHLDDLFRHDLGAYCASLVGIKAKDGAARFLSFNPAQRRVDRILRRQQELTGRVRAIILKARQLGISTYIAARYYRKTSMNWGQRTYILTHEDPATQNLFGMAKRIHDNMEGNWKPAATTNNANELDFGGIDSGYRVGTAKNVSGLGRSQTVQNFHGSEVAFWPHADVHFTGVMEGVPSEPHTEILLESTANGIGGEFYELWTKAERGASEYVPIFLPWFWDPLYRDLTSPEFEPSVEEIEYQERHKLDNAQLSWAHHKNIAMGGLPGVWCWKFKQEYPASAQEAFQTSGADSLISPEAVHRAREFKANDQDHAPRVMGVDVARGGGDFTRFIDRQGRRAGAVVNETHDTRDLMQIAGMAARHIDKFKIARTFIDITGLGSGVYDRLQEMGYGRLIRGINFGQRPTDEKKYRNKRAEMWDAMRQWLEDKGGAQIPDENDLHRHICAPTFKFDSNSRLVLEPKEEIHKRLGFSPDGGDALCLTFAEEVHLPAVKGSMIYGRRSARRARDWQTA